MDRKVKKIISRAEAGDTHAQHELAIKYATGDGVDADYARARYWYAKAADQRDVDAMFNLGTMYLHGEGGKKSKREALQLFKEASKLGSSDATILLGEAALARMNVRAASQLFAVALLQGDIRGLRGLGYLLERCDSSKLKVVSRTILAELKRGGVAE